MSRLKVILLSILFFMVGAVFSDHILAISHKQVQFFYVKSNFLNVRAQASTKSKKVGKLKYLQEVTVTEKVNNGKWWKITKPIKGYVFASYLISAEQKKQLEGETSEEELSIKEEKMTGSKKIFSGFSILYWLGGPVYVAEAKRSFDKEPNLMFKYFYDKMYPDGMTIGFFAQYAPSVKVVDFNDSGTMKEFGVAYKFSVDNDKNRLMLIGINLGYRMVEASGMDTIQGFGLNGSFQLAPDPDNSKFLIEGGFLSQPAGGNEDSSVTWEPIAYLGIGFLL